LRGAPAEARPSRYNSLRQSWGDQIFIDLVTCYATLPKGFEAHNTRIYRVADYRGRKARALLYGELAGHRYSLMGIICSGEPVMTKWKWVLALRIPARIFIINENGDYFWLDRKHAGPIRRFCAVPLGFGPAKELFAPWPAGLPFRIARLAVTARTGQKDGAPGLAGLAGLWCACSRIRFL